jgi:hypothetical protein
MTTITADERAAVQRFLETDYVEYEREAHRRRYAKDPWAWLTECVTTIDELDPAQPVKPFPVAACRACARYLGAAEASAPCGRCGGPAAPLAYLRHLAEAWHRAEPPLLLIPKARRMLLTWLFTALHAWLAWRQPYAKIFFVSSKEDKSAELLDRAHGILERLPLDRCAPVRLHRTLSPPLLQLDNGAMLFGVAEGAEQLRQYTATAILADEIGTWQWPRAAYTAFKPCVDGGGRLTLLSSAYPGFWAELVRGEVLG